jgi:hypothetical protein
VASRPKFSRKAYNAFVRQIELDQIWLEELHLTRPSDRDSDMALVSVSVEGRYETRGNEFDAFIRLEVSFSPDPRSEDPGEEVDDVVDVMRVEIVYGAAYSSELDLDTDMLDQFNRSSARLALWPYLRETLQSTLQKAGQASFALPVFSSLP